jgi:type I restriction enzyme M protein
MSNPAPQLVQELWNYCNILRDDGLSYGDYVEQLALLLFLKMADEQSRPPYVKVAEPSRLCAGETNQRRDAAATVPKKFAWPGLLARGGQRAFMNGCTGELA